MMASFGRKKLFEILNKAKAELEAERSETSSIVSDNASEVYLNLIESFFSKIIHSFEWEKARLIFCYHFLS